MGKQTKTSHGVNLAKAKPKALLALHGEIMEELRRRGIVRSSNNPTGDLAEYIFCKAFGWKQANNSSANVDAVAPRSGRKFQIKGRRITARNKSRQLSAIRDLKGEHFDYLAGVLFNERYEVIRAIIIPHKSIVGRCKYVKRTNSHKLLLEDDVWNLPKAKDVTEELRAVNL